MGRIWDDVIPPEDRVIYEAAGFGERGDLGERPAIVVIDVNYSFVGDKPEPLLESIKRFPNSCGEVGWEAVWKTVDLLEAGRAKGVPIFFTTGMPEPTRLSRGSWAWKKSRGNYRNPSIEAERIGNDIVAELGPREGETVINKTKPSAFFGTPLHSYLQLLGIDDLIITGTTTSGCIRATVLDAFNFNFHTQVVEECTFDRGQASHKINLFDMNAKYADVLPLADVVAYIRSLPDDTYRKAKRYLGQPVAAAGR